MGRNDAIGALLCGLSLGLSMQLGIEPEDIFLKVWRHIMGELNQVGYEGSLIMAIYALLLLIDIFSAVADIFLIISSGWFGVIATIYGFISGLILLNLPLYSIVLLIIGYISSLLTDEDNLAYF